LIFLLKGFFGLDRARLNRRRRRVQIVNVRNKKAEIFSGDSAALTSQVEKMSVSLPEFFQERTFSLKKFDLHDSCTQLDAFANKKLKTMNGVTEQRGLSARQKTSINSRNRFSLCAPWSFIAIALIIFSCQSDGQKGTDSKKKSAAVSDSLSKPQVNIKVNRHYDDKGNVVGFDSTYTSFYSNLQGDTLKMDSLMRNFDSHFGIGKRSPFSRDFDALFFNDSLRYPDFFHQDFFLKRYELNDLYFRDMMRRMDSLKNDFYREHSKREKDL
jgi:hypothetical protein